jgi:hypothetical protein
MSLVYFLNVGEDIQKNSIANKSSCDSHTRVDILNITFSMLMKKSSLSESISRVLIQSRSKAFLLGDHDLCEAEDDDVADTSPLPFEVQQEGELLYALFFIKSSSFVGDSCILSCPQAIFCSN